MSWAPCPPLTFCPPVLGGTILKTDLGPHHPVPRADGKNYGAVKFVPKWYSPGEIEALKKNPNVLEVRENRLLLTIGFRHKAWIRWTERSTASRMPEANWSKTIYMSIMTAEELVESGKSMWAGYEPQRYKRPHSLLYCRHGREVYKYRMHSARTKIIWDASNMYIL